MHAKYFFESNCYRLILVDKMKQVIKLISTVFCLINMVAVAQPYAIKHQDNEISDSLLKAKKVRAISSYEVSISKRGKTHSKMHYKAFDDQGKCVLSLHILDSLKHKRLYNYSSIQRLKQKEVFNSNVFYNWQTNKFVTYNDSGRVHWMFYSNKRGKIKTSYEYLYKNGQLNRLNRYHNGLKLSDYYLYQYKPDGKLLQSSLYNKHGKIKSVWDYSCSEEGKAVKQHDTFKLCTQTTYLADGSEIITSHFFEYYTQEPIQVIVQYNALKQLVKYVKYKGKNRTLIEYRHLTYDTAHLLQQEINSRFDKKGHHSEQYIYNPNGSIAARTDTFLKGHKLDINRYQYTYNEHGLIQTCSISNKDRLLIWRRYEYVLGESE